MPLVLLDDGIVGSDAGLGQGTDQTGVISLFEHSELLVFVEQPVTISAAEVHTDAFAGSVCFFKLFEQVIAAVGIDAVAQINRDEVSCLQVVHLVSGFALDLQVVEVEVFIDFLEHSTSRESEESLTVYNTHDVTFRVLNWEVYGTVDGC